ncbi:hypothetical protein [Hanstruepera ponticola]|uniref:hypothetical protein n=1 Tax=Hanstruepera ponticola TaxID=2042995 RepID=UPI000CF12E08|nr:hypothetical protein [Hanstruepera ponticola]
MKTITNTGKTIILCLSILLSISNLQGQTFEKLNHIKGHNLETYYSNGSNTEAEYMAALCDSVISFYSASINFKPKVTLLVLSPTDWNTYTHFPVYGMPHYPNEQTLVVAAEDNGFWKSMLPPIDQLPKDIAQQISNTYVDNTGNLTMREFFDLLAIHELGHAFHEQGNLTMQRKWIGELFCNMFLHNYIAEKQPELLPALTVFPNMVVHSTNKNDLKFTTLGEFEENYGLMASQFPQNYGWYQCRLHTAAGRIYDETGVSAFQKLWNVLQVNNEPLDDTALATLLLNNVHENVANVQLKWDN